MINDRSQKACEMIAGGLNTHWKKVQELNKSKIRAPFNASRIRANTVYALLIASIFITLLGAMVTCIEIIEKDITAYKEGGLAAQHFLFLDSSGFNLVRILSFVLLALTCSVALITIVRKDKSNAQLLSKLKSANRRLEEEVRKRTSELAEAIGAKDHFLGIATHDLKAPLNGIMGLVELIKIENNSRSASVDEYLAHIDYSCRKMQRLVHDILEINRIEQGKAIVKMQGVDLAPLLTKLLLDFAQEAARKNIALVFEEIHATIQTDADSVTRILENLLSNAIKFSPPGKKVSLRVHSEDNHLKFAVSDEGPGIPPEEQPRLFNKFQRLSNRPTGSEISTGLGLSIVKELTSQLGGEISFKTAPGKGTVFILTLPKGQ